MRDQLLDSIHAALLIAEYDEKAVYIMDLYAQYDRATNHDDRTDIETVIQETNSAMDRIEEKINALGFSYDIMSGNWIK